MCHGIHRGQFSLPPSLSYKTVSWAREVAQQIKAFAMKAWWPDLDPQNPGKGGKREQILQVVLWPPHHAMAWEHTHIIHKTTYTHIHTHSITSLYTALHCTYTKGKLYGYWRLEVVVCACNPRIHKEAEAEGQKGSELNSEATLSDELSRWMTFGAVPHKGCF